MKSVYQMLPPSFRVPGNEAMSESGPYSVINDTAELGLNLKM